MNFLHPAEDKSCYELNEKKNKLKQLFGRNFGRASIINRQEGMSGFALCIKVSFLYIQVYGCFTEQFR